MHIRHYTSMMAQNRSRLLVRRNGEALKRLIRVHRAVLINHLYHSLSLNLSTGKKGFLRHSDPLDRCKFSIKLTESSLQTDGGQEFVAERLEVKN